MTTETETFRGHMQRQAPWHKTFIRSHRLQQFRFYIEESMWDESIAREELLNRMCIGIVIVALLYFTPPVLMMLFQG